jgi:hypothetical protein
VAIWRTSDALFAGASEHARKQGIKKRRHRLEAGRRENHTRMSGSITREP